MARVVVSTNEREVVLDLTCWKDDSIEIQAKIVPAVVAAIEKAYEMDQIKTEA